MWMKFIKIRKGERLSVCLFLLVHRHPLLAFFYYPVYLINQGLMSLLGINCVQFLVAIVLLISSLYAFLLMIRIGRELLHLSQRESSVLAFLLFSLGVQNVRCR